MNIEAQILLKIIQVGIRCFTQYSLLAFYFLFLFFFSFISKSKDKIYSFGFSKSLFFPFILFFQLVKDIK